MNKGNKREMIKNREGRTVKIVSNLEEVKKRERGAMESQEDPVETIFGDREQINPSLSQGNQLEVE